MVLLEIMFFVLLLPIHCYEINKDSKKNNIQIGQIKVSADLRAKSCINMSHVLSTIIQLNQGQIIVINVFIQ